MSQIPRVAIGEIGRPTDRRPVLWALMDVLERRGIRVQAFLPQSRFAEHDAATVITGQPYRHLDVSLMSRQSCREFFWHGARDCDLAIIEGRFAAHPPRGGQCPVAGRCSAGASLAELAEILDSPRLAIVDVGALDGCRALAPPPGLDGVLLDRAPPEEVCRLRTWFEGLWGVPVLGVMGPAAAARSAMADLPLGQPPPRELCADLGGNLHWLRLEMLLSLAGERRLPPFQRKLFRQGDELAGLKVAVACDAAFRSCFPESLDLMELHGARVRDFSPLADDGLPEETNLVLLGSGCVERYAEELASNHCLKHSLHAYVRGGGRVYAEGGGLAWLGRQLVVAGRNPLPMAGILPTIAFHHHDAVCASAACRGAPGVANAGDLAPGVEDCEQALVDLTLAGDSWLGEAGARLRGYLDARWRIGPLGALSALASEPERRGDLIRQGQVIGSRVTLHFAAQGEFLDRLFRPALKVGLPVRV